MEAEELVLAIPCLTTWMTVLLTQSLLTLPILIELDAFTASS